MAGNRLGQNIHRLRKEKGITQEELGSAVGVTAQAVSNWECGGMPDAGAAFYLQKKGTGFFLRKTVQTDESFCRRNRKNS